MSRSHVLRKTMRFNEKNVKTIETVNLQLYKTHFEQTRQSFFVNNKMKFAHKKCAEYVTDVEFQQSSRLAGSFVESRHSFSKNRCLYGFKTRVLVTSAGGTIYKSNPTSGSLHNNAIFLINLTRHRSVLKKVEGLNLSDSGPKYAMYLDSWAILCYKAYDGSHHPVWVILLLKTSQHGFLTSLEEQANKIVFAAIIIVESFFGQSMQLQNLIRYLNW